MRGWQAGPIEGAAASGEPQHRALFCPAEGEPGVIDEPARRQAWGMAPIEDRLGDVGREEGQFDQVNSLFFPC